MYRTMMRIAACLVANTIDALCTVGDVCEPGPGSTGGSLDLACSIAGKGLDLVQTIGRNIAGPTSFELSARCIGSFVNASTTACDVVVGSLRQDAIYAAANDGWIASGIYDVDSTVIMFVPTPPIHIWSVFAPFSSTIWIILAILAFVVTPLVSSIVEYVDGETIAGNYKLYLPDSVHAYAGVDALKRTGSVYSRESAVLSAVVAIIAKIIIALYTCNLAAYVLESYMVTTTDATVARGRIVATVPEFATTASSIWTLSFFENMTRAYDAYVAGTSGITAVMGSESFLRLRQRCDESILIVDGPFMFRSMALSKTFAYADDFDRALRWYIIQQPPIPIAPIQCTQFAQSIQLDSTFGIFVAFVVGIVGVTIVGTFMHITRHADWSRAAVRKFLRRSILRRDRSVSSGRDASSGLDASSGSDLPESGSLPGSGSLSLPGSEDDDDDSHKDHTDHRHKSVQKGRRPNTPHNSPADENVISVDR